MKNGIKKRRDFTSICLDSSGRKLIESIVVASRGTLTRNRVLNVLLRLHGQKYLNNVKRVFEEQK